MMRWRVEVVIRLVVQTRMTCPDTTKTDQAGRREMLCRTRLRPIGIVILVLALRQERVLWVVQVQIDLVWVLGLGLEIRWQRIP